jgi:hypothetical protein
VELGPHSDKPSPIRFRPTIHMNGIAKNRVLSFNHRKN